MATVAGAYFDVLGTKVELGRRLSGDREADVFALADDDSRAARIYRLRAPGREAKLRAMVDNAPPDASSYSPYSTICWPERLIYGRGQEPCGFVALKFQPSTGSWPLLYFCDPTSRKKIETRITWRSLVRIAINLCGVMEAVHAQGHVIGDINEENLFVSDNSRVSLVNCESIQVRDNATGRRYMTNLGNTAFTAPEHQGCSGQIEREIADDHFALAVVIFMLLMNGAHPFEGVWHGDGVPPTVEDNIREGRYAYARWGFLAPGDPRVSFENLPPALGTLFERCFINGLGHPSHRPSAEDWRYELQQVETQIEVCRSNPHHFYSNHLERCPWCGVAMKRTSSAAERNDARRVRTQPKFRLVLLFAMGAALVFIVLTLMSRVHPSG